MRNLIPFADAVGPDGVVVVAVAVAAAVAARSNLSRRGLSADRGSALFPFFVAHFCCVADGRYSCGCADCLDWSKPACRCYRSVPCWAWCARSVYAASTALGRSGFCCTARIETHRSRRCRPTDLAAEPDTQGLLLLWILALEMSHRRWREVGRVEIRVGKGNKTETEIEIDRERT